MQGQTVRESSKHLFRRPPHPSPACTPPPPPSHPTCQTPCSSAPWARHPCPCPCDLTALRCPRFWKQTPKRLLTTICITQGSIRRRSPLGTPRTHGYPPVGLDGVKHHRLALSQVCHLCLLGGSTICQRRSWDNLWNGTQYHTVGNLLTLGRK